MRQSFQQKKGADVFETLMMHRIAGGLGLVFKVVLIPPLRRASVTTSMQKEKKDTAIHKHTMSKRHADSTQDENPPKRRQISANLGEAVRNGDTTALRAFLEKLPPNAKRWYYNDVHAACFWNHDECLALLLRSVETTQMEFGVWLSECVHANHVACTEVLLQHWKSVCKNKAVQRSNAQRCPYDDPHDACPAMWSDPAVCRVLIDAGADIETKDERGRSPLHRASDSGALDVVKMLVEAGAGVRVIDHYGDTCLTIAAFYGHIETVCYLVGLPEVDVNHQNCNRVTVLHRAARGHGAHVVQLLIDAGADIETKDNDGFSPLHRAIAEDALDIVEILVEAGARVCATNDEGETSLTLAVILGHTETVRYLVGLPQVEVNHQNCKRETALHCAARGQDHADVVELLIDAGADIEALNYEERSPLHCACESGALDVVEMLVRAGARVCVTNHNVETCLHSAACSGHTDIVRYILALPDVELNGRDHDGETALHHAVRENHADVVQLLIAAGANIEALDNKERSPLYRACEAGALDVVERLVRAGARVRFSDYNRLTCLHFAAYSGHTDIVCYLLALPEVDVNGRDDDDDTALHRAVRENHADVVQLLIDVGADIDTRNYNDQSPLDCANDSGAYDIVEMLVEAGAVEESQSSYTPSVG